MQTQLIRPSIRLNTQHFLFNSLFRRFNVNVSRAHSFDNIRSQHNIHSMCIACTSLHAIACINFRCVTSRRSCESLLKQNRREGSRRMSRRATLGRHPCSLTNRVGEVQLVSELCVLRSLLLPAVGAAAQRQLMIVELELERRGHGQSSSSMLRSPFEGSHKKDGKTRGQEEGSGTFRYANGDFYVGERYAGKREGRGTIRSRSADGAAIYEGEWKAGQPCGLLILPGRTPKVHRGPTMNEKNKSRAEKIQAALFKHYPFVTFATVEPSKDEGSETQCSVDGSKLRPQQLWLEEVSKEVSKEASGMASAGKVSGASSRVSRDRLLSCSSSLQPKLSPREHITSASTLAAPTLQITSHRGHCERSSSAGGRSSSAIGRSSSAGGRGSGYRNPPPLPTSSNGLQRLSTRLPSGLLARHDKGPSPAASRAAPCDQLDAAFILDTYAESVQQVRRAWSSSTFGDPTGRKQDSKRDKAIFLPIPTFPATQGEALDIMRRFEIPSKSSPWC